MQKGVPQIMDVTSIKSILHYLSREILPSRFETAQQPEPNTVQIGFRGINNTSWIEVSWQGDCARIIKINRPDKLGSQSTLAKQLSYGLKYMALVSIEQDKFERIIKFAFAKKPGDLIDKYLIFELMGKHSNIFYLDKNLKIIAAGRQVKSTQSSYRTISTGNIYKQPPLNIKKEPNENETFQEWKSILRILPDTLKNSLLRNYQGVSPILIKQIEYLSNLEINDVMNKNVDLIDDKYLKEIFIIWNKWIYRYKNNKFKFAKFNHYFYSVWFSETEVSDHKNIDLCEGLSSYYNLYLNLKKMDGIVSQIDGLIFKQMTIERKNHNLQSKLLENSENFESLKNKADNIFLKLNLEKKDILEAEKLYKKSKKLKRAINLIKERQNIYENKLNRLEEYRFMLDDIKSNNIGKIPIQLNLLEELKYEICDEFNLRKKRLNMSKIDHEKKQSSPIHISSPGGLDILIGRNMRQNDLITFKLSKKQDLWFHAQESPGSHVLLKSSSKIPNDDDIQIAADLAAFFCRAKGNIKVPINQVKVKDLQKISKAGLGCVSFKQSEIIWGNPTRGKDYMTKNTE